MIVTPKKPHYERYAIKPRRPVTRTLPIASQCKHFGKLLDRTKCGQEVYSCRKHGTCSHQPQTCKDGMQLCDRCEDYSSATWRRIRIDDKTHCIGRGGVRLNASCIPWKDGYLLAYRSCWGNADVEIVTLDKDYRETMNARPLRLSSPMALDSREDPRLFIYRGVPHVWYNGYNLGRNKVTVHYAELDPIKWKVVSKHHPKLPFGGDWEKNHAYFDRGGDLHAVYSINPHRVYHVRGNDVVEDWTTHYTPPASASEYGEMRGGASPVLFNHAFYNFFHYMTDAHGYRLYSVGVYTFDTDPPYRVRRMNLQPIDVAEVNKRYLIDVLFPVSAFVEGDNWVVTMGVHDEWSEVRYYPVDYIERSLVPV